LANTPGSRVVAHPDTAAAEVSAIPSMKPSAAALGLAAMVVEEAGSIRMVGRRATSSA
tara:strand:- start:995 stop:1168 length:174 start_codon:yes stop_codon:yes gene_type:complete